MAYNMALLASNLRAAIELFQCCYVEPICSAERMADIQNSSELMEKEMKE